MDTYHYNPAKHYLVINGDGANWITACRDYFYKNTFYKTDHFHVMRDIRYLFKGHPRYRAIRKKATNYDGKGLIVELNSAVGTLETDKKEEDLEALINQLSQYPEALGDYRVWLKEQGVITEGMRTMGSAEGTMSVFADRLKGKRSWSDRGMYSMIRFIGLDIRTLVGTMKNHLTQGSSDKKMPGHYREKLTSSVGEATRQNIAYLTQSTGKPIYNALKGLQGF